jgi:hypothetical protein
MLRLVIAPIAKLLGTKLTTPAGRIAANALVPKRETIILSTNCIIVKDKVVITVGAASFNMYLNEVSSAPLEIFTSSDLFIIQIQLL